MIRRPELLSPAGNWDCLRAAVANRADAMKREFDEQYDNRVYQFQWGMRHEAVRDAVTNAVVNRWGK